jgi:hypothetical protein
VILVSALSLIFVVGFVDLVALIKHGAGPNPPPPLAAFAFLLGWHRP